MGSLKKRLEALENGREKAEERKLSPETEALIERLTLSELRQLVAPFDEAAQRVPGPIHERQMLALRNPEARLAYQRRWEALETRRAEILSRPPRRIRGAQVWDRREAESPRSH